MKGQNNDETNSTLNKKAFRLCGKRLFPLVELPRSVKLCKTPAKRKPYAKEGTDAHECLEFIMRRHSNLEKAKAEAAKNGLSEMIEHAPKAVEVILKLRPTRQAKLLIETRVFLKQIGPGLFGTLDYAWVDVWGELVVIDYKYSQGVAVFRRTKGKRKHSTYVLCRRNRS